MQADPQEVGSVKSGSRSRSANKSTLELCFVSILGVFVLAAFVTALTYNYVSAIAPLCIMVPLLILVGVQLKRTLKVSRGDVVISDLLQVVKGRNKVFNAVAAFIGWMAVLLAMIFVAGHYVAMAVFMLVMLRVISKEPLVLSAAISATTTAVIYLLFESGFNIEMYRGLLDRLF